MPTVGQWPPGKNAAALLEERRQLGAALHGG